MNDDELTLRDDIWRIVDALARTLREAGFQNVTVTEDREGISFYDERSSHELTIYPEFA